MKATVHIPALVRVQPDQKPAAKLFDPMVGKGHFPFQYVPAVKTDVAATIARVRAEIANGERKL